MRRIPLLIFSLALCACVGGTALRTQGVPKPYEISGTFDVILFGGTHLDDVETIAILDVAGDGYEFVPFAPDFRYKRLEGLPAKEAMDEALHHVSFHRFRVGTYMRRVLGEKGETIAYEIRPIYSFVLLGVSDALDVSYWLREGGKVRVEVALKERVERRLRDSVDRPMHGK